MKTTRKVVANVPIGSSPGETSAGREAQMVSLAMDLAEQQLREGTASSQVITFYLKLGTENAKLERERLHHENLLLQAKTEQIQSSKESGELYANAIEAMRRYSAHSDDYE